MKALIKKYNFVPVLLTFFVMGFCDVVGISTSYVKNDFNLSETVAGFVPSMVFIWFLLLGVPTALLMNRIGRKKTVQISNIVTFVGMLLPFLGYNIVSCLTAFALLGIGNDTTSGEGEFLSDEVRDRMAHLGLLALKHLTI